MSNSIKTTTFDYNYHSAQKHGNHLHGEYVRHNIDIYNKIGEFNAVYQTAGWYEHNDYQCPTPTLSLSADGGTDRILIKIDNLIMSDLEMYEANPDLLQSFIEELDSDEIKNFEDLKNYYDALNENLIDAKAEFASIIDYLELSNDLDDYKECEETGLLTLKEKA